MNYNIDEQVLGFDRVLPGRIRYLGWFGRMINIIYKYLHRMQSAWHLLLRRQSVHVCRVQMVFGGRNIRFDLEFIMFSF